MISKNYFLRKAVTFSLLAAFSMSANAQIKYTSSGKLTIGDTTPYSYYPTTHNGSIYLKDNSSHFFQIDNCISRLKKLRTYSYKFKDEEMATRVRTVQKGGNGNEYGMLAQEVEKVFPNLVITDNEGKKLINYTELIPVLVNAVQQLSSEVEKLKAKKTK